MKPQRPRPPRFAPAVALPLALALALVTGCSGSTPERHSAQPTGGVAPSGAASGPTDAGPSALPTVRVGRTVSTGLDVPWGVAPLLDGSALVAEGPTGRVVRLAADGTRDDAGTVPGVRPDGEGGLLGLAVVPGAPDAVFAYLTSTSGDNRVVRMPYDGRRIGAPVPILTGIPSAGNHNGGRLLVGPDGTLWIGTGDAGRTARAQDRASLGGKILRITTTGTVPADNPFPGSPVWSYGHRNVQGLAFDSAGRLWATEFGQNTWDELNRIEPGGNYGWPLVEGRGGRSDLIDPQLVWRTDESSPSGLAIVDDVAYVAALRGQRLWQVPLGTGSAGSPRALLTGSYGRLRTVLPAPGGGLWLTTSNRDGRGSPAAGDDRILLLQLGF